MKKTNVILFLIISLFAGYIGGTFSNRYSEGLYRSVDAGSNNLAAVAAGEIIRASNVNQYRTALNQDIFPRNSSGVPTDGGGSGGSSSIGWLNWFYTGGLFFDEASKWKISRDGGDDFDFDFNSVTQMSITSAGVLNDVTIGVDRVITSSITDLAVTQAKRVLLGEQVSASSGSFTTTINADVTNLSVTITTTGRPVFIGMIDDGSGGGWGVNDTTSPASTSANLLMQRDGSTISTSTVTHTNTGAGSTTMVIALPCSTVSHIDVIVSGTYTYKMRSVIPIFDTLFVTNCKLVAFEL